MSKLFSFKPYYKWNTFNTKAIAFSFFINLSLVLNLIINGIPSIPKAPGNIMKNVMFEF